MTDDKFPTLDLDPEAAAALQRQYDIDYVGAGPKAPVSGFAYCGFISRAAGLSQQSSKP